MKPKVLLAGLAAAALLVVLARIPGDQAPASPPNPVRVGFSEVKDRPEMASYRVFEDPAQGEALPFRGANYSAKVGAEGLSFEAGGHRISLRARRVEQGGAAVDLAGAAPERTGFGSVSIPRAPGISEQFVFENRRTEHLVRIERPLGEGALTVKVAVGGSLNGPVQELRRGNGAWVDPALENGGLVFTDASGKPGMTYTDAVAIDAKGRKQYFDPRWENGEIALTLPAEFVKDAAYPILIDPWLELQGSGSATGISGSSSVSETPALALDGSTLMVAWSDSSSGNFDVYFRYWNGFAWTALGTSAGTGGVSNNAGTSTNPSIGFFTPTNTGFFHPYLAWEDDTSGSINIYGRFWTGTDWVELDGSASSSGISKRIGALCRNPQAVNVIGLVDNAPTSTLGDRTEFFPCVVWEEEGDGIASRFFYPGDDRLQPPPARWYPHPSCLSTTGSQYLVLSGSAARPSVAQVGFNDLAVAFEASTGTEYDVFALRSAVNASLVTVAAVTHVPGPAMSGFAGVGSVSGNVCTSAAVTAGGLSIQPSLAVDGAGALWVAWQESLATGEREIYAARSAGGAWAGVGSSATGGGVSRTAVVARLTTSSFPSIAVSPNLPARPLIAWEDDAGTNPEIYVRRLNAAGTSWDQVADEGSAMLAGLETVGNDGGISRTGSFSLRPRAVAAQDGSISVAWRDGAAGSFDLFLRRYHDNEPRNLAQVDVLTSTALPVGGTVSSAGSQIQFTSVLFAETAALPTTLRLQLEIRPTNSIFTGQPTHESLAVAPGGTATILFTGLPNVNYHWRARSVDAQGRNSPWLPFGGNADGDIDFRIDAAGAPPNTATGGQSKDKCGLLGAEALLGLGLAALLRRRRAARA
jgi:MYXO-CTERM domain-containing protein